MVFTFVISTLVTLWGIDRGQAGMLGTVTLLFSAIGGWGAGILADRYGRVRILQITILWFSVCTVGIGFTQNRSEEHTSELQSLMRISYAVFCLKKKTEAHMRP